MILDNYYDGTSDNYYDGTSDQTNSEVVNTIQTGVGRKTTKVERQQGIFLKKQPWKMVLTRDQEQPRADNGDILEISQINGNNDKLNL